MHGVVNSSYELTKNDEIKNSAKVQANKNLLKLNNSQEKLISEINAHWFSVTPATVPTPVSIGTCSLSQIPTPLLKH